MRTFISYASDCKKSARRIKKQLDHFGFNCFLAHEDIPPQTEWPARIVKELDGCDLFLPLLTTGFIESFYCQQETGFAFCKKVEILPVMIEKAPMGMIADMQAVRFNINKFTSSCWRIVKHIGKNESLAKPVLDAVIEWFGESETYDMATKRALKILNEFDYAPCQVRRIRNKIENNRQIYETKEPRDRIFKFMDKYPRFFDRRFRDWYDSRSASRKWMRQ